MNLRQPYSGACVNLSELVHRIKRPQSWSGKIRTVGGWPSMRLLVVEDNALLSQLLAKGLATAGYETDLLATAAEARAALMTTSYAAVILDLGLPDGDGLSILRELRHRKDPTPVLVASAGARCQ